MGAVPDADAPRLGVGSGTVVVVIGLVFLSPFVYVLWRNVDLGADVGEIIWDANTLHPLRRSLSLASTVALSSVVVGTGLAWLTIRTDLDRKSVV